MRYVPTTPDDVREMLSVIGAGSIDELFAAIPAELRRGAEYAFPEPLSDPELVAHMTRLAARNRPLGARPSFLGAGCYRHFVPAVVDALAGRGEFVTAYTPYQPEASQGTLQAGFEFQSLVCELTGLDIANASLYDGATALVEAVLMACKGAGKVLIARGVHPEYRRTLECYVANLPVELEEIDFGPDGRTPIAEVRRRARGAAVVAFQSPAVHGVLEDCAGLAAAAHDAGAVAVQVVDPHSLAILAPPGDTGVDVACGEGQSLGSPPSFGGPSLGLLAARAEHLRRMPGRIIGRTADVDGRVAYTNTLQTREQHIRRERATSNICTNAQLMALRATIYLAALGRRGLRAVAEVCRARAHHLATRIAALPGFALRWPGPFYKEVAVRCPAPAAEVHRALAARGILGGYDLGEVWPEEERTMVLCVTEMNPPEELDALVAALAEVR